MDRGYIQWKTCCNSTSFFGYKIDILKSALQKYLRRRERTKMIWCIREIYLFHVLAQTIQEKKAAKAIITNLLNRIIIMLDEELLFIEWEKYLHCRTLLDTFETGKRNDCKPLINICNILANAELLRLTDDIAGYYWRGMKYWDISPPKTVYTAYNISPFQQTAAMQKAMALQKPKDSKKVLLLMANFIEYFDQKNPECFYWVFQLFELGQNKITGGTRFHRNGCEYIIWEYLLKKCGKNQSLTQCITYRLKEFFVRGRGERHIFLTAAIMLVMHQADIDWQPTKPHHAAEDNDPVDLSNDRVKLTIDGYAIDMHCSQGRRMGKNKVDFIMSGAVVIGENKQWFVKKWRDVYNNGHLRSIPD